MSHPSSRSVLGLLLLFTIPTSLMGAQAPAQTQIVQPAPANVTPTPPPDVRILFTGRLLGYLGLPEQQSADPPTTGCPPVPGEQDTSTAAVRFIKRMREMRDPKATIILGTGDNFAPTQNARQFSQAPEPTRRSKDMNTWDWVKGEWIPIQNKKQWASAVSPTVQLAIAAGTGFIESDNVACFLAAAQYDAIVPGVHDFYFGPERLRYLARFLATPRSRNTSDIAGIARVSNVVSATTSTPHNLLAGDEVVIAGVKDTSFNGTFTVTTVSDATHFNYVQTAANAESSRGSAAALGHIVHMLAANLVIQTTYAKARTKLADVHRHLPYVTEYPGIIVQGISDGKTVLPWLQSIKIQSTIPLSESRLCEVNAEDPSEIESCPYPLSLTEDPGTPPPHLYRALMPALDALHPGNNYALCTAVPSLPKNHDRGFCIRFSVYSPFFLYPNSRSVQKTPSGQKYSDPLPYLFKKLENGTEIAVFGIVDPSLRDYIGKLDYVWENKNGSYKTEVAVSDPAEALEQQVQYFEREYRENRCRDSHGPELAACESGLGTFRGIKLLLAQMSPPLARQLAARLRGTFSVVISEADSEQATPNETVTITPLTEDPAFSGKGISRQGTTNTLPPFVAVPPPYFDDSIMRAVLQIRQLDVSRLLTSGDARVKPETHGNKTSNWSFRVSGARSVDPAFGTPLLDTGTHPTEVYQALQRLLEPDLRKSISPANPKKNLTSLALYALKMKLKADVALMQTRDFYIGPPPEGVVFSSTSPTWIDGILWKGDLATLVMVKGSTLLKVLKDSKRFDEQDAQTLSLELHRNRGLVQLGIFHDALRDEYLINGEVLDPNRLYSVATTDYIGVGDTGYPEIAELGFGNPQIPQNFPETLYTISGLICDELKKAAAGSAASYNCPAAIAREPYMDPLSDRPFDRGPSLTAWRQFELWTHIPYIFEPRRHPPESRTQMMKANPVELSAQDRRVWFFSHSSNISLTATDNSVSESQRKALFSGIASPSQLQAKESHEMIFSLKDRMGDLGRRVDFYLQPEMTYDNVVTGQSVPPAVSNFKQNLLASEFGLFIHRSRDYPRWGLLLSVRDESQLRAPFETVTLSDTKKTSFSFRHSKTNLLSGHFGFRAQNRHSFFEGGFEATDAKRVTAFNFAGAAGVFSCPFASTMDAQDALDCVAANSDDSPGKTPSITKLSTPSAALGSALHYGWFSNMQLVVPFFSRLSYVFTNQFDYFYSGRSSISTDIFYRDLWSNSLSMQITRNFSVAPKFDVFFYQNQVKHNSFLQVQSAISLKYGFDWFSGSRWKTALKYTEPKQ